MKKELVIVGILMIAIIALNGISQGYTVSSVDKITKDLNELKDIAQNMEEENDEVYMKETNEKNIEVINEKSKEMEESKSKEEIISNKIEKIKEDWYSINYKMSYYIEHDELEKVNSSMVKFEESFKLKEYKEGMTELENCKYILKHIKDKESINIINFF